MLTQLLVEARKLKGSPAVLLTVAAPAMVSMLLTLILYKRTRMSWDDTMRGAIGLWSFFVLPMTVTALTALLAQIEHGPRAWDHILSLPTPRWRLFAAKAIVTMTLTALMSMILLLGIRVAAEIVYTLQPSKTPPDAFPWVTAVRLLGGIWAASLCMSMIQLWVALRITNFIAPITLGIAGTFVAVMASGAEEGIYFPWLMPLKLLVDDGGPLSPALTYGVVGGLGILILMMIDMSRREV
jgi:lantibiotic transport system permease protein